MASWSSARMTVGLGECASRVFGQGALASHVESMASTYETFLIVSTVNITSRKPVIFDRLKCGIDHSSRFCHYPCDGRLRYDQQHLQHVVSAQLGPGTHTNWVG